MELHIPSHLTNLEVVRQLKELLQEYNLQNNDSYLSSSMDGYLDSQVYDYVRKFIERTAVGNISDEATISYLVNLFYDAKGTYKIFYLMEKHLGMKFKVNQIGETLYPKYTIDELVVEFQEASGIALNEYLKMLKNFLYALLYFYDLSITIDLFNLYIVNQLKSRSKLDLIKYKEFIFNYND